MIAIAGLAAFGLSRAPRIAPEAPVQPHASVVVVADPGLPWTFSIDGPPIAGGEVWGKEGPGAWVGSPLQAQGSGLWRASVDAPPGTEHRFVLLGTDQVSLYEVTGSR